MKCCGVSDGIATTTGTPALAPYAESAPAALPAEGATRRVAPRARAAETAIVIPRALNDPVGLTASSLIHTPSSISKIGVHPSHSVMA